jgi:hypothetical protein
MSQSNHLGLSGEQTLKRKLSFPQKVWVGIVLLVCIPVILFLLFWLLMASTTSEREIAGPVTISTEWVEFTPESPLMPDKDSQEIVLDSAEPLVRNNSDLENITLTDGTVVKVEAQFVDKNGNAFPAAVNRYPTPSLYENGISCSPPYLREDRIYRTVRVRSDKPLKLKRIVWHCRTYK